MEIKNTSFRCGHENSKEVKFEDLTLSLCKKCAKNLLNEDRQPIVLTRFVVNYKLDIINSVLPSKDHILDQVWKMSKRDLEDILSTLDMTLNQPKENKSD